MNKMIKHIYLLSLFFCISLLVLEKSSIDTSFLQNITTLGNEYFEVPGHIEHSHSHGSEDIISSNSKRFYSDDLFVIVVKIPVLVENIIDYFVCSIWQPPRNS